MNLLLETPEAFIANNKNLGRAYHSSIAAIAGTAILGTTLTVGAAASAAGTAALTVGAGMAASALTSKGGSSGSTGVSSKKGKGKAPPPVEFNPVNFQNVGNVGFNPTQGSQDMLDMFPNLAEFATQATAFRTQQREEIMPGAGEQFRQGSSVINSWLKGEVGQDVVDFTNRQVAQRTGGSFNPFTGGGRSQQAFARSIGRTSADFQQAGISAAPSWQSLANSFVTGVDDAAKFAFAASGQRYQYDALNANINQFNAQGQFDMQKFNSDGSMRAQMANTGQGNINREFDYQSGVNDRMFNANQSNLQFQRGMDMAGLFANGAESAASIAGRYQAQNAANLNPSGMTQSAQFAGQPGYVGNFGNTPAFRPSSYKLPS